MIQSTTNSVESSAALTKILEATSQGYRLRLHGATQVRVNPQWGERNRVLPDYHLALAESGEAVYEIGSETIHLIPGRLLLISHGVRHSTAAPKGNYPCLVPIRFGIVSPDSSASRVNNASSKSTDQSPAYSQPPRSLETNDIVKPFYVSIMVTNFAKYIQLFGALYATWTIRDETSPGTRDHFLLCAILSEIRFDMSDAAAGAVGDLRIERARKHLTFTATRPFSADELSQVSGLSPHYLCRRFKEVYGMTPKAYHARVRLTRAREVLQSKGGSVKQVAFDMGYSDQAAFSRAYKKLFGTSPSIRNKDEK